MERVLKNITKVHMLIVGIIGILISAIPLFILKGDAPIYVQDQLDGEIFTYLFHAKGLFDGSSMFPQVLGGVDKTAFMPPSVLGVLFFVFLTPLAAFIIHGIVVQLTAFIGMFLFLTLYFKNIKIAISFLVAGLFSFLAFFTVYGLSIAGIPLLAYAFLELKNKKSCLKNLILIIIYGLSSSFVLVGYSIIMILFLYCGIYLLRKKWKEISYVMIGSFLLLAIYIITNSSLFLQMLGIGEQTRSHKEEIVIYGMNFWEGMKQILFHNTLHAPSWHEYLILPAVLVAVIGCFRYTRANKQIKSYYRMLWLLLGSSIAIAAFYGFFHCPPVVAIRNEIGGFIKYFQIDRFYWLYPFLWYFTLALLCVIILEDFSFDKRKISNVIIVGFLLMIMSFVILKNSDFYRNMNQIRTEEKYKKVSWNDFYGVGLVEKIVLFINKDQASYRVGSIGLHPAVSLFHGFYTIDGYSNNYALEYKKQFRKVIEKELQKDVTMEALFDNWGNRCYLFTSHVRDVVLFPKGTKEPIDDLELNTAELKKMNCRYLLSSVAILNYDQLGMKEVGVFNTEQSFYTIWLYEIP